MTYGGFASSKKLFIFENNGKTYFPIFNDIKKADDFAKKTEKILLEHDDNRGLSTQMCAKKEHASDMLKTIATFYQNAFDIVINPKDVNDIKKAIGIEIVIDSLDQ